MRDRQREAMAALRCMIVERKRALPFLVCKDVFDSSGVDKASLAVVFEVVESHGDAAQGLEAAV
ncbi:hypothetical protein, partial [Bifidobacterium pseudolongum]|uniref:hypothetical protein n=1 Tax=Bifidobacterium pseudolongum TaxID=1694 RepID=UPI001A91D831